MLSEWGNFKGPTDIHKFKEFPYTHSSNLKGVLEHIPVVSKGKNTVCQELTQSNVYVAEQKNRENYP